MGKGWEQRRILVGIFCLILGSSFVLNTAFAQSSSTKELKRRQQELRETKRVIQRLKRKLQQLKQQERNLATKMNLYQKQAHYLNRYLELLQQEIQQVQLALAETEMAFDRLQQQLTQLRREFQTLVQRIYRERQLSAEEFLLLPEQLREEARVTKYMQQLLAVANRQANRIVQMQDSLDCVAQTFDAQLQRLTQLYWEQQQQQLAYEQLSRELQQLLAQVRRHRSQVAQQLRQRQRSARMLQTVIAKLEQEAKKVSSGRKRRNRNGANIIRQLQWPTRSRRIIQPYGSYRNPQTGIIIDNVGIGISAPYNSPVYAAAGGVVSLVHWLPGYGTVVIIDHGSSVRTVYANLAKSYVVEGQVVRQGEEIGRSGRSVDGEYVHFEIWQGTQTVNPAEVLP